MSNWRPPYKHTSEWLETEAALTAVRLRREAAEAELEAARLAQAQAVRAAAAKKFYRWDIGQAAGISGVTVWKILKAEPDASDGPH